MTGEKSALPVVLLGVVLLALTGVMAWKTRSPHQYVQPPPTTGQLSPVIVIDVYIDVSGSMRHFLTSDQRPNTFREILRNCEFALKSGVNQGGWDQEKRAVRFWKFGPSGGPQRIDKGDAGSEGALRGLADDPGQFSAPDTPIESAVNATPPAGMEHASRLMILITDLYQSDGKLERPAMALGRRFLAGDHGAVAVYGIRNPYQGAVGDLPGQGTVKLPDAATSMPFYILIAGEVAADVRHAQDLLTAGEYGAPLRRAKEQNRLFAAYFSKETGRFASEPVLYDAHAGPAHKGDTFPSVSALPMQAAADAKEGMAQPMPGLEKKLSARVTSFVPRNEVGIASMDLEQRPLKSSLAGVSWARRLPVKDGPIWQTADDYAAPERRWRIAALYCEAAKNGTAKACPGPPLTDKRAVKGIHICAPAAGPQAACSTQGDAALSALIDRSYLTKGKKYLIQFDEIYDATGQSSRFSESSALMRRWNLNTDEVHDLLARPDRAFASDRDVAADAHPGKTPNVAQLLTALQGFVMSSGSGTNKNEVILNTYFLYVNAR